MGSESVRLLQVLHLSPYQLVCEEVDDAKDDGVDKSGCDKRSAGRETKQNTGAEKEEKNSNIEGH